MGILFWVVIVTGRRCGTFGKQRFIRCVCCMFGVVTIYHVVIKRVYMVACCECVGVWVCGCGCVRYGMLRYHVYFGILLVHRT
jgi:hypothetical protein